MKGIEYKPIGIIRSPYQSLIGMPIQPAGAEGVAGTVEIDAQYREGIKDLSGFSHIILIYHFHMAKSPSLLTRPYLDDEPHGIFSTRYPARPNPIGISVVRLLNVEEHVLHIEEVDILDGTPLLDIKPYVPEFDVRQVESIGWLSGRAEKVSKAKSR